MDSPIISVCRDLQLKAAKLRVAPGMACPLPTTYDQQTAPPPPANYAQLTDRRYTIERALDELAVVEVSADIEDLAGLLGVLEAYRLDNHTHYLHPAVFSVDGYILDAKGIGWHLMNQTGPAPLPAQQLARIRQSLEAALGQLLSVIFPDGR
ncbi:hypothetical protein [Fibrella arboris]|uniref:hypothetical protein n=1 Tax=Fibrella arboris TaxID=3242486 RepID=UPI003522047F